MDEFLDALADGGHEKWRFNDERTEADRAVNANNRGGETHTFTPVAHFGGGFIEGLNMGQPPIPECAAFDDQGNPIRVGPDQELIPAADVVFTPAGGDTSNIRLTRGANRFQCCIHPWMRSTVTRR